MRLNQMDLFELKRTLNKMASHEEPETSFSKLKLQVERALLVNIAKDGEILSDVGLGRIKEIETILRIQSSGYACYLSGCQFTGERHRDYVRHIKSVHLCASNIICNFKHVCLRRFRSVDDLVHHVKEDHVRNAQNTNVNNNVSVQNQLVVDIACKCNMISCGVKSRQFSNIKELVKHMNTVHLSDSRVCIFDNCSTRFKPNAPSRYHFARHHLNKGDYNLKRDHLLQDSAFQFSSSNSQSVLGEHQFVESDLLVDNALKDLSDEYESLEDEYVEATLEEDSQKNEQYFLDYFADFYNRMAHEKFVPHSTVQAIAEEYLAIAIKSQNMWVCKLRSNLERLGKLNQDDIKTIVDDLRESDQFLQAQQNLNTQYKRNKYVKENMKFVDPIEITLNESEVRKGAKKEVFHYVPVVDSLRVLLEDKSFNKLMANKQINSAVKDDRVNDITDGSLVKNNVFFQTYTDAYGLHFYSDAVEIGKIKICSIR